MVLNLEEQADIWKAIEEKRPDDFRITGRLWTLGERGSTSKSSSITAENAIIY